MSTPVSRLPDSERLRLLGIMGVDVYVPRAAPLARPLEQGKIRSQDSATDSTPHRTAANARLRVSGDDVGKHPILLAAVMRSARVFPQEWSISSRASEVLPEWHFGEWAEAFQPALTLPNLADLRESIAVRRATWHVLRSWLRNS